DGDVVQRQAPEHVVDAFQQFVICGSGRGARLLALGLGRWDRLRGRSRDLGVERESGGGKSEDSPHLLGIVPQRATSLGALIACPTCRCVCSAMWVSRPITVVGNRLRPTVRGSRSVETSSARTIVSAAASVRSSIASSSCAGIAGGWFSASKAAVC